MLNELLEACAGTAARDARPRSPRCRDDAIVVVAFNNVRSFPARVMRRYWSPFFAWKSVYFDTDNLDRLMDRSGCASIGHASVATPTHGGLRQRTD